MQTPPAFSAIKVAGGAWPMTWARGRRPAGAPAAAGAGRRVRADRPAGPPTPRNSRSPPAKAFTWRALGRGTWQIACGTVGHVTVLAAAGGGAIRRKHGGKYGHHPRYRAYARHSCRISAARGDRAGRHPGTGRHRGGNSRPLERPRPSAWWISWGGFQGDAANPDNGLVRILAAGRVSGAGPSWSTVGLKPERLIQQLS